MKMGREQYLLQQPKTLESLAMKKIAEWIASHAEKIAPTMTTLEQRYPTKAQELLARQIEIIRNHIERRLPGRYYDEAMTELKKTLSYLLEKVRRGNILNLILKRMIETLFTKNITSLSFDLFDWENFGDSFYSKSHLIPGLTHLTLYNVDAYDYVRADDILQFLEMNFKLIDSLKLHSPKITDGSIDILVRLSNLKSVNLYATNVSETGIQMLLTSCPYIEHIVTKIEIGRVLENIANLEKHDERRFNLKSYVNRNTETFAQQQLVVKMCPSIEKLQFKFYMDHEYENPEEYFKTLQNLQSLRELELFRCEFYTYQVKELLQASGSNLVYLHLFNVTDIDLSALKHISLMCPNLQSLDLYRCDYIDPEDTRQNHEILGEVEMSPLINLKRISVTRGCHSEDVFKEHIIFLISACPNIEYINILRMGIRDIDNFILEVLEKNSTKLKYLRELRIYGKNLSESVIAQIVQNCVNHPEIISVRQ